MSYLVDSHTWLWFLSGDSRLGRAAAEALQAQSSELFLSAATGWELGIKISLGKLQLDYPLEEVIQTQRLRHRVHWLDIKPTHCKAVTLLPFHHRDPFDRLLVAQAQTEGLKLLSRDVQLDAYGVCRVWD